MKEQNFKDEPFLFISCGNAFEITNEGMSFLYSINDEKVSILSIIGPKSSGKSFLFDQLLGTQRGFSQEKAEHIDKTNIKGIWAWRSPILRDGHKLLLFDSNSFFQSNTPSLQDTKIFSLFSLISSFMIYNVNKDPNEEIEYFIKLSENLNCIKIQNDKKINAECLPLLIWLQRDFKNSLNEQSLLKKYDEVVKKNDIFKLYKKQMFFYLPSLLGNNDKQKFFSLKKYLYSNIKNKELLNVQLTGKTLNGILQYYLDSLNSNSIFQLNINLEKVALSSANEKGAQIANDFKISLSEIVKQKASIIDIYKLSYERLESIELSEFFESTFCEYLQAKDVSKYIKLLIRENRDEIDKVICNIVKEYEKEISIAINNYKVQKVNSLQNISEFFNNISNYFKFGFGRFISSPIFKINNQLIKAYNQLVVDQIKKIGEDIALLLEDMMTGNKLSEDQLKQQTELFKEQERELIELKKNFLNLEFEKDKIEREANLQLTIKERELKNREQTIDKLRNEIKVNKIEEEKKSKIFDEQIDAMNKEIKKTKMEIESKNRLIERLQKNSDDVFIEEKYPTIESDLSKVRDTYNVIKNILNDYRDAVQKMELEKDNIFKSKALEKNIKEADIRIKKWTDEFQQFKTEQIKEITEKFESKILKCQENLNSLNLEKIKLQIELEEQKQSKKDLESKNNELLKEIQEQISISKLKDSLIQTQKAEIELYRETIEKDQKKKDNLEFKLNEFIVNSKMKEDEIEMILVVINDIFHKRRERYPKNLEKLSTKNQEIIRKLVNDFKVFK